ncbi:MAG TPA: YraN family protein [Terriglobales bacterium]|nr:YraN family protein [Terriglobales bacterium]
MKGRITRLAIRAADFLVRAERGEENREELPPHLIRGRQGEDTAYFYLREQGYVMVARNFRSPRHRGEIDLIGWDGDVLCFVEVKTRRERGIVPAEMAVDGPKRNLLRATARDYLRRLKKAPAIRFDVISLYFDKDNRAPDITLFKNAFSMS